MSLTIAAKAAQLGLAQAERKIAVVAGNINNADKVGYTRKSLETSYAGTGSISLPIGGKIVQAVPDVLLVKQINAQSTSYAYQATLSTYLADYAQSYGSTGGNATTLSSTFDNLTSTLQILESDPSNGTAKAKVVASAQAAAGQLNSLSVNIQAQRL